MLRILRERQVSAMCRACIALLDAAAEALVLVDPQDPSTIEQLVHIFAELSRCAPDAASTAAADAACETALAFVAGTNDLANLGASYAALNDAVHTALDKLEPTPATPGERSEGAAPQPAEQRATIPMSLASDPGLLRDFVVRAFEYCDAADEHLLALERVPSHREAIDAVFRAFHTIKGMAGFLDLAEIVAHAHASEDLLAGTRASGGAVDGETIASLFGAVDQMRTVVAHITSPGDTGAADPPAAPGTPRSTSGTFPETVRVDESRLDELLDTIGELVIAESMALAAARADDDPAVVDGLLVRLDKITRELQQMATAMRMVPLRATFRRMARLVRDLAEKSGKKIDLVLEGEETELDKVVVDAIYDPLVHAVRNAVDHGIEPAPERLALGKPAAGRITLRAYHTSGAIHVEVSDDGRGVDTGGVARVARERGLLGAEETLDPRALLGLVCEPGFSTAAEVTDVSGRGVGMDVVRRTVETLRGHVELSSENGMGTTLSVRLPITLAIIDGMVARVGGERYIIPVLSIERSARPLPGQIATVAGVGEMLVTEEGLVPLIRLHRLFEVEGAEEDPAAGVVVITSEGGTRAGLLACELLGQQQTVIKPVGDSLPDQPGIAGAAIMPDGRVGLILDAAGLIRAAHQKGE